jgi:Bacterial Ig domain
MRIAWRAAGIAAVVAAALLLGCRRSETPEVSGQESEAARQARLRPPFGLIDAPGEGSTVASGSRGAGWALDDSGVAKVEVALDESPKTPAQLGQPFPGVHEAYPTYPGSDKAGFTFTVPSVAAGSHLLIVTISGKDGGKTELKRHINIQ